MILDFRQQKREGLKDLAIIQHMKLLQGWI